MSVFQRIRETMGLNQEDLASFLSLSKSHLAMAEIHQRELPSAAHLKLSQLQLHLTKATARPQKISLSAKERAHFLTLAQVEEQKAIRATQRLEKMRLLHNQLFVAQQVFTKMLQALPPEENKENKETKGTRLWLKLKLDEAQRKAATCGVHAQAVLELKAEVASYHAVQAKAKATTK